MELCSSGHDEVCFVSSRYVQCPACEVLREKDEMAATLETEIKSLERQLEKSEAAYLEAADALADTLDNFREGGETE